MEDKKALKVLNPRSVWLPVVLGLVIVFYLAYTDDQFSVESFRRFKEFNPLYILFLLLVVILKDGLNALRVRFISHQAFDFYAAVRVILLWEFAIAVTPPFIGAAAVLIFIIYKEGLSFGKALACTLLLASMDNLFFLTASPLVILLSSGGVFPVIESGPEFLSDGVEGVFWLSYLSIGYYTLFMFSAVLWFPKTVRKLLSSLMGVKILRRWKDGVMKQNDELILASQVLKGRSFLFWLRLLILTYAIWIAKFFIVNLWLSGFQSFTVAEHAMMLGKHLMMWIVMLVSPSPGNAGTAEFIFPLFYQSYAGEYTFISSLLWRISTYYPYLIVGVLLIPRWWKKESASTEVKAP